MSQRERAGRPKAVARLIAPAAFALLAALGQAHTARAQWATSGSDINNTNTGNVGIGTASPAADYKLDVRGLGIFGVTRRLSLNADFGGNGEWSAGAAMTSLGGNSIFFAPSVDVGSAGAKAGMAYFNGSAWYSAAEVANVAGGGTNRGSLLLMRSGGNVGVGTATPGASLHVFRDFGRGGSGTVAILGGKSWWDVNDYERVRFGFTQFDSVYDGGGWGFGLRTGASDGSGVERLRVTSDGRVGIGTASPLGSLHVPHGAVFIGQNYYPGATLSVGRTDATLVGMVSATNFSDGAKPVFRARSFSASALSGDGIYTFVAHNDAFVRTFSADHLGNGYFAGSLNAAAGLCIGGDCKTSWSQVGGSQWSNTSTGINYSAGNVGVGTSAPDQKLSVQGMLGLHPQQWTLPSGRGLYVFHNGAAGQLYAYNYPAGTPDPISITGASLTLSTFAGGNGYERLTIASGGNVGVGAAPTDTAKLHVAGNINATGNITADGSISAKYQDVAEWVPASQKLAAGTVVVLDRARSNHVLASAAAYDTGVAGVVSARPGLILGEEGEGKVMVATTGRVRVRVDATRGPIQIGDLLVTSDTPGVAMRSEPVVVGGRRMHAPGTIIGKALEPLAGGVGEILVLLSLQ